jgi:hypothetical protein
MFQYIMWYVCMYPHKNIGNVIHFYVERNSRVMMSSIVHRENDVMTIDLRVQNYIYDQQSDDVKTMVHRVQNYIYG